MWDRENVMGILKRARDKVLVRKERVIFCIFWCLLIWWVYCLGGMKISKQEETLLVGCKKEQETAETQQTLKVIWAAMVLALHIPSMTYSADYWAKSVIGVVSNSTYVITPNAGFCRSWVWQKGEKLMQYYFSFF